MSVVVKATRAGLLRAAVRNRARAASAVETAYLEGVQALQAWLDEHAAEVLASPGTAIEAMPIEELLGEPLLAAWVPPLTTAAAAAATVGKRLDPLTRLASTIALEQGSLLVVEITASVRQVIRETIGRGIASNWDIPRVTKELRACVGLHSRWARAVSNHRDSLQAQGLAGAKLDKRVEAYRQKLLKARAYMIARTETAYAENRARYETWASEIASGKLSPNLYRVWIVGDPCPVCAALSRHPPVRITDDFVTLTGQRVTYPPVHPNCFPGNALVQTAAGRLPIRKVAPGSLVLTAAGRWRRVRHKWQTPFSGSIVEVRLEDGRSIRCTREHPFALEGGGWRNACDLQAGDEVVDFGVEVEPFMGKADAQGAPAEGVERLGLASVLYGFPAGKVPAAAVNLGGNLYVWEGEVDGKGPVRCEHGMRHQPGEAARAQRIVNTPLEGRAVLPGSRLQPLHDALGVVATPAATRMGGESVRPALFDGRSGVAKVGSGSAPAGRQIHFREPTHDERARYAEALRNGLHAQSFVVARSNGVDVDFDPLHAAPPDGAVASRAGARIATVIPRFYRGALFNLTVDEDESFTVEGIGVHNCKCSMGLVRVTRDNTLTGSTDRVSGLILPRT